MELLWLYYRGMKNSRYILLLYLGTRNHKMCGLDARKVKDRDRRNIAKHLAGVSLEEALAWLRNNCQDTFRTAYRELVIDRAELISRYDVDPNKTT